MTEQRFDDEKIGGALDLLNPAAAVDVDRAFAHQRFLQVAARNGDAHRSGAQRRWFVSAFNGLAIFRRPVAAIPVAAAALFGLSLLTSPMQSLAGQFLTIFRVQDFQPITISTSGDSLRGVPDLTRFGDMTPSSPGRVQQPEVVADLSAAGAVVGFPVKTPSQLPTGVEPQPSRVAVTAAQTVTFTFSAEKTRAYLDSIGQPNFNLPAKFDGASIQVNLPAAVLMTFSPSEVDVPSSMPSNQIEKQRAMDSLLSSVMFGEAKAPTVDATGVSFAELRDFLLSLPGLPADTAAQIRAIGDLTTTLPVPVPTGTSARKVQVNGSPGLILAEQNSRLAGAILWQSGGVVYGAAGALNEADLMSIANSVR